MRVKWYHGIVLYYIGVLLGAAAFQLSPLLWLKAPRLDPSLYPVVLWLSTMCPGGLLLIALAASLTALLSSRSARLAVLAPIVLGMVAGPLYWLVTAAWLLG